MPRDGGRSRAGLTSLHQDIGELPMRLGVRAIAAARRERVVVDPEEIYTVGARSNPAQATQR